MMTKPYSCRYISRRNSGYHHDHPALQTSIMLLLSLLAIASLVFAEGPHGVQQGKERIDMLRELLKSERRPPQSRVVNGEAASKREWPWQVSLQIGPLALCTYLHICGGSLIRDNWVLTAAHCVDGFFPSDIRIQAGVLDLCSEKACSKNTYRFVKRIIMHPEYDGWAPGYPNDIALVELDVPFKRSKNVDVVRLPYANQNFTSMEKCYITGWGATSGTSYLSPILLEAQMTNIANKECQERWTPIPTAKVHDHHICPFAPLKSACGGDSGGPYVCGVCKDKHRDDDSDESDESGDKDNNKCRKQDYVLAGLTSWGINTCSGEYPSVYVRPSSFLDWINTNMQP